MSKDSSYVPSIRTGYTPLKLPKVTPTILVNGYPQYDLDFGKSLNDADAYFGSGINGNTPTLFEQKVLGYDVNGNLPQMSSLNVNSSIDPNTEIDKKKIETSDSSNWGVSDYLSLASLGLNAFGNYMQASVAMENLEQKKHEFALNTFNQAQTINGQLRDRQIARNAASGGGYESLESYMNNNAVKTSEEYKG